MPELLEEICRIRTKIAGLDPGESRNRLTEEEYFKVRARWELADGMLRNY